MDNVFDFGLVIGPPLSSDPKLLRFPTSSRKCPATSGGLVFGLAKSKDLNKSPVTLMNADKTRINADKMGIISAGVAECAVDPTIDPSGSCSAGRHAGQGPR